MKRRTLIAAAPALVGASAAASVGYPAPLSDVDLARFNAWLEFERHFQVTGIYDDVDPYAKPVFGPAHDEVRKAVAAGPKRHAWILKPIPSAFG